MYDPKKSDTGIVAMKPTNDADRSVTEPVEQRPVTNGNRQSQSTDRTQSRVPVSQAAERIRQFVRSNPQEKLTALLHHITPQELRRAFFALKREAAPGADGLRWNEYREGLDQHVVDLHRRVHTGAYRATAVRRVNIPKPDGGTRPLGVAGLEDKIVQRALVEVILTPIYEEEFEGFSYGYRPGRGAHDALDAVAYAIDRRKVNWIVDADIRGYFESIDREWLMRFLGHRIGDRRVLRLIVKWLRVGVMEEGRQIDTGRGTAQGSVISPILANIYLHYVLDLWVAKRWRPQEARGQMMIVRYADDYVVGFEHRSDAERFLRDLTERFSRFGLELHPEKTRLIEFGRHAQSNRRARGEGRPETFDFLGFTHYCRRTRRGRFGLGRKPVAKRMSRTLKRIGAALRMRMHEDVMKTGRWLGEVLRGWLGYYAVPTSFEHLKCFVVRLQRIWLRILRERTQRDHTSWARLRAICARLWPKLSIVHPWPQDRFAVNHRR